MAGGGTALGDNGPATSARLSGPTGVAVAPDGSLAIADTNQHRVRLVGTDGTITTLAGDGTPGASGDGGPPRPRACAAPPRVAYDADGRLLIADAGNSRVRRIGIDGRIETLPVTGLERADRARRRPGRHDLHRRRRRPASSAPARSTAASARSPAAAASRASRACRRTRSRWPRRPASPSAATARSPSPSRAPIASPRVAEPLPGFGYGDSLVGSGDGSQIFQFDPSGRHLRTLDALTGAVLRRFTYDSEGRLAADLRRRARRALAAADDRAPERDDDPADARAATARRR